MSDQQDLAADLGDLSDEDRQIERLLASMVPREARVNRDRLMFLAGQVAAGSQTIRLPRLRRCLWPLATACSACLGLIAGFHYGHVPAIPAPLVAEAARSENKSAPEPVSVAAPVTTQANGPFSLIALQNRWLTAERDDSSPLADALGNVPTAPHPPTSSTYPELLRQLLTERS
jgi:hypothetical protein